MRECQGCEGSGRERLYSSGYAVEKGRLVGDILCRVCGGTGQVEAKPSVLDAVADAETLHYMSGECGWADRGIAIPVREAEVAGHRAFMHLMNHGYDGFEIYSFEAARAAFRAVPGLRGDK